MRQRTVFVAAVLAVTLGGCIVSPQPEPPNVQVSALRFTQTELMGDPGAVLSGMGVLWLVDIKGTATPIEVPVRPDGSFGPIDWSMRYPTGEVLAHNRVGARPWSTPFVFQRDPPTDGARVPTDQFSPCLDVTQQLDFGTVPALSVQTLDVTYVNNCGEAVEVGLSVIQRLGNPAFDLVGPPFAVPNMLNPGQRGVIQVRFTGMTPGYHEDILVISVRPPGMSGNFPARLVVLLADSL